MSSSERNVNSKFKELEKQKVTHFSQTEDNTKSGNCSLIDDNYFSFHIIYSKDIILIILCNIFGRSKIKWTDGRRSEGGIARVSLHFMAT